MSVAEEPGRQPRGPVALALLALFGLVLFAGFVALGTWQVYRLGWKRDLIARVDARVHAPPVAAPGPAEWPGVNAQSAEYRNVELHGRFLHDRQTLVWTATDFGTGYWLLTPLQEADGSIVLVNRGFVPTDWCGIKGSCAPGPTEETAVTGLLRMSESPRPFRHNDPSRNSWYTRDLTAIATARGLTQVAPYFVDQDAAPGTLDTGKPTWPQGGLTVISFPNNHLSYLITWYLLALMVLGAGIYVARDERRLRSGR
jgi:surfeit locus 1 family protein